MKKCSICREEKELVEFCKHPGAPDGLQYDCRSCARARTKDWLAKNAEKHRATGAAYRARNKDLVAAKKRAHYEANRDKVIAKVQQWVKENPGKAAANSKAHKVRKQKACPAWADKKAIAAVYEEAARRSREEGQAFQVDHIVPLQGKRVSGLHVRHNLRVIPALENIKKGNRFQEEG
jgi:hypothetical protein